MSLTTTASASKNGLICGTAYKSPFDGKSILVVQTIRQRVIPFMPCAVSAADSQNRALLSVIGCIGRAFTQTPFLIQFEGGKLHKQVTFALANLHSIRERYKSRPDVLQSSDSSSSPESSLTRSHNALQARFSSRPPRSHDCHGRRHALFARGTRCCMHQRKLLP